VKFITADIELFEFLVRNFDASLIGFRVEFGMNLESGRGCGSSDETHDGLEISQRLAAPILTDVGKETMLDLVPLARPRWEMADDDA
jgi:hypothetical protein